MRKIIAVLAAAPLFTFVAGATDYSRESVFLGADYVKFNPNSGFVPSFNAWGGSGQFVYNVSKSFGVAVDLGAVTKGTLNQTPIDTTVADFVAGPRFTYHNHSRFTPFVQVLFGGAYATTSTQIAVFPAVPLPPTVSQPIAPSQPGGTNPLPITARLVASNTDFAMLAGGGLDIKLGKHVAFRPIEADYYLTRLPNLFTGNPSTTSNRNNFRYTAGFNFMFGAR